jgi:FMN phosphatase YigB (HAD superfamily)
MKPVKCLVFDAYGTLFDVHSIVTALDRRFPGQGAAVSEAWRTRQLEYTWLRSMMIRGFLEGHRVCSNCDLQCFEVAAGRGSPRRINGSLPVPQSLS